MCSEAFAQPRFTAVPVLFTSICVTLLLPSWATYSLTWCLCMLLPLLAITTGLIHLCFSVPGCYHNGTRYGEGSMVPTLEPCLSCKCSNRILTCALKVCPEQPIPPPRGCILVQHKTSCCPHMTCRKFNSKPLTETDRRVVNFLNDFESEQKIIQQKYGDLSNGNTNFLRRSESTENENDNSKLMFLPQY